MNMLTKSWERWGLAVGRIIIGYLWFTQLQWKMPPTFGCLPGFAVGDLAHPQGLCGWTGVMARYSILPLHQSFVQDIVLPNISWMGWGIWLVEVFLAVSLLLGLLTRLGGLVGIVQAANLYLGLSAAPNEWYWAYGMLITLQLIFFFIAPGRTLGVDQYLIKTLQPRADNGNKPAQALLLLM